MGITQYPVYTVGHSNHSWEEFVKLLLRHRINEVADVRSSPYSRYVTHFNHQELQQSLEDIGIGYTFLGSELGGRPADRSCYDAAGQVLYDRVAETDAFDDGIRQVMRQADDSRIALLCTEKDPLECHRTLLVAKALSQSNIAVEHILSNGSLENHDAAMSRLLRLFKLSPNGDMFRSKNDTLNYALSLQAKKMAYTTETPPAAAHSQEDVL